jgi:hypothetical protein
MLYLALLEMWNVSGAQWGPQPRRVWAQGPWYAWRAA